MLLISANFRNSEGNQNLHRTSRELRILKFGTKHEDIVFAMNPSFKDWTNLISHFRKTFKENPDELTLLMHCYAGHGMSKDGR